MNRRRSPEKRGWPANLYQNADGYFYYRNPANKKRKGLGHDKAHAFSEARAANKALASMTQSNLAQWVSGVGLLTFKEWLPIYRKLWETSQEPAESTIAAVDRYVERFKELDFAWMPLGEITTVHISKYLDSIEENSGPGAAVNIRARLMDVFSFAMTKGHIEPGRNPVAATLPAKYAPKRDRLSLEQFIAIRSIATPWLVNAMNLAILTGQRVSDISAMKFADVHGGHLHVTPIKMQGSVKLKIDMNIRLAAVNLSIADVVKQCRDLIVSKHLIHQTRTSGSYKAGECVTQQGISGAFSDLRDMAGVKPAAGKTPPTFHEIRSLSERLYRKEYNKEFAQALLGHKTESMSAKYDDLRGSAFQLIDAKSFT